MNIEEPVKVTGTVAVWRNHAIEPLQPLLVPFLQMAGLDLELVLGGYDDTLALPPSGDALLDIVWFDLDRLALGDDEARDWFVSRVARCAASAGGPVVVVPISERRAHTAATVDRLQELHGVRCADPWIVCDEMGVGLIDERTAALTGTRVSRDAQVQLARALGARWLPAALLASSKMLAIDLDETLHRGVLGEDGVEGVIVTPAHARLHAYLKELAAGGVLLALVSRTEPEDVGRLFTARRADYGLALDDFVAVEVSWGSKADAVRRAAAAARIAEDAVVFVDDNAGELLTVGLQCPGVALIHARADADRTID
ncbi:MAG: HAD-IIIC family phosphatase, partial [Mycobacterium sp.]